MFARTEDESSEEEAKPKPTYKMPTMPGAGSDDVRRLPLYVLCATADPQGAGLERVRDRLGRGAPETNLQARFCLQVSHSLCSHFAPSS